MKSLSQTTAICLLLLVGVSPVIVSAQESPLDILRRSITARASVTYSGIRTVVVFENGVKVRGVEQRVHSHAPDRMRIDFIAPQQERGRINVVNGNVRWDYDPATGRAVRAETPTMRQIATERLQALNDTAGQMRLQYTGRETVAGLPAHVIKVYTPAGVTVRKSWIDTRNYLSLKTQRFDADDRIRSSVYFSQINFDPSFSAGLFDFEPPAGSTVVEASRPSRQQSLGQAQQQAGFGAVLPDYLPPGYALQSDRVSVIEVGGRTALWLSFSNGIETFSLFQRRHGGPSEIHQRGRSITWSAGDYCFTLMGSLPEGEMRRVKDSIRP